MCKGRWPSASEVGGIVCPLPGIRKAPYLSVRRSHHSLAAVQLFVVFPSAEGAEPPAPSTERNVKESQARNSAEGNVHQLVPLYSTSITRIFSVLLSIYCQFTANLLPIFPPYTPSFSRASGVAPLCKGGCHGLGRDWGIVIPHRHKMEYRYNRYGSRVRRWTMVIYSPYTQKSRPQNEQGC